MFARSKKPTVPSNSINRPQNSAPTATPLGALNINEMDVKANNMVPHRADLPRRLPDIPMGPRSAAQVQAQKNWRTLNVGRDICLSGEIAACDQLVVEGTVEAAVKECQRLEITQSGLFKGSVQIEEAEISGRFEGTLVVRGKLRVRATGQVKGDISYGSLEVESGGQIDGNIRTLPSLAVELQQGGFQPANNLQPTRPEPVFAATGSDMFQG